MDVLIIDDEKSIRESTTVAVELGGHYAEGVEDGATALKRLGEDRFDLAFLDLRLGADDGMDILAEIVKRHKDLPVVMFTAHASVRSAVDAMRAGAFDYLEKPFSPDQIRAVLARAEKAARMRSRIQRLEHEVEELKTAASAEGPEPRFESDDPATRDVLDVLFRAADSPASVMLLGETGTGKSVVARAVHARSHLADKPFVTISCPSLSKELLESELFGHVKGAFTGAVGDKWDKVHAARGGTLFLDEIGELPPEIQPKLLRLLQEREYERVGENKTRPADVRVIAATNRDLAAEVKEGRFREDLFYRLNVIAVEIPPLRNRGGDLVRFAEDYLAFFARRNRRAVKGFSKEALGWLVSNPWPGNLRELRNVVERAVILCQGEVVTAADLSQPGGGRLSSNGGSVRSDDVNGQPGLKVGGSCSLDDLEAEHIRRVLDWSPSIQAAAETLGIDQATLYRKRKKMGLA